MKRQVFFVTSPERCSKLEARCGLNAVLTALWQSGTIYLYRKRGCSSLYGKRKRTVRTATSIAVLYSSLSQAALVHLLLMRIHSRLMQLQRSETSGFTPEKPQTYRNIVLCVLVESRREFRQGILASYVDLKGFVSVHLEALWDFIQLCGIS